MGQYGKVKKLRKRGVKSMKKHEKAKCILFMMLCTVLLSGLFVNHAEAKDNSKWTKKGNTYTRTQTFYFAPKGGWRDNAFYSVLFPTKDKVSAKKITKLKSSNKKVLELINVENVKQGINKGTTLGVIVKKKGTATISFQYKSEIYKQKCVVKKRTKANNGLKFLKLGGYSKNYASKYNDMIYDMATIKKSPSNVTVQTKKNWVIKNISILSYQNTMSDRPTERIQTAFSSKKGKSRVIVKSRDLKLDNMSVAVTCVNKRTGEQQTYYLMISRQ